MLNSQACALQEKIVGSFLYACTQPAGVKGAICKLQQQE